MTEEVPSHTLEVAPPHYNVANQLYLDKKFHRRVIAVLLIICTIVAIDDLMQRYRHGKVLAFLIQLKEGEYVQTVGILPTTFDLTTDARPVITALTLWVHGVHGLTTDLATWRKLFSVSEAYSTMRVQQKLQPVKDAQRKRLENGYAVDIDIVHIQPLAGTLNRGWEVDWRETTTDVRGLPVAEESGIFHGTFTVAQLHMDEPLKPGDYVNAIRVYVEDFKIQKRSM